MESLYLGFFPYAKSPLETIWKNPSQVSCMNQSCVDTQKRRTKIIFVWSVWIRIFIIQVLKHTLGRKHSSEICGSSFLQNVSLTTHMLKQWWESIFLWCVDQDFHIVYIWKATWKHILDRKHILVKYVPFSQISNLKVHVNTHWWENIFLWIVWIKIYI